MKAKRKIRKESEQEIMGKGRMKHGKEEERRICFCVLFHDVLIQIIASNDWMTVNNELESIWKEAIVI
jgi:hypothetical protein